ncbi:uncharacterized protein LOC106478531 [Limulus polyphemus]|uniref:Uncharacterized protein LOC106478531 n=1 Tax=Limulus polyphemus TaxID=6850 RepID=A0ABM1C5G6_LIMPO|nr:uncharacterized protein LOC106478531 [Limulus polyphemus]
MSVRQHSRSVGSSLQVPPTIRVTNMQSPDDTSQPHVFTVSDAFLSPATSCLELKTDPETLCTSPCNHLAPGRYRNKITLSSKPNMKNTLTTFDPSNINDSNSVLSVCNSLSLPNRDGLSSHCISSHKDFQFSANETTASESLGYQPHQSGNPIFPGSLQSCQTSDQFVSMKSASTDSCKSLRNSVIKVKNVSLLKAAREQNSPQPLCLNSDAISITTSVSDNISPSSTPKGNKTNLAKKNLFTDQATMSCRNSSLTRHCELENEQHIKLIPPLLIERSHSNENSIYQEICLGAKNNCERGKRKMETQTAKRAGYIIASFVLLWLPQPLTTFLENSVFTDVAHAHNIQMFTVSVATFSAAMNPIVYGLAIKQFRATFITMVLNQWRRWKQRWLW